MRFLKVTGMVKIFTVVGKVGISVSVAGILINLSDSPISALVSGFFGVVNGVALIALGRTIKKVDYLKKKLNICIPWEDGEQLAQTTCFECGYRYDLNYSEGCPSCANKE